MSWTDKELDDLFRGAAEEGKSFAYKEDYWKEMEALLPEEKSGRDVLWIVTSVLFIGVFVSAFFRVKPTEQPKVVSALNSKTSTENNIVQRDPVLGITNESEEENLSIMSDTRSNSYIVNGRREASSTGSTIHLTEHQDEHEANSGENSEKPSQISPIENFSVDEISSKSLKSIDTYIPKSLLPLQKQSIVASANHAFYIQSVIGASQSLVSSSDKISGSFGLGLGWAYRRGDFILNTGVNTIISNHSDLYLTRTAKVYGFGSSLYTYNFNYRQLFELEGVIECGYQHNRSEFKLGVRPSYLLSSKVSVLSTSPNESASSSLLSEEKQVYSFTGGLKRFGLKPTVGYAFHVQPDLELGVNVGVQLFGRINESYVEGEARKWGIDGQLYLRKNFSWRKK